MPVKFTLSDIQFLVVDDSAFMRRLVVALLRGFGAKKVREAAYGAEALEILKSVTIDIAILDWEMPELSGHNVLRLIRNPKTKLGDPRVILLTAHSEATRVMAAKKAGADGFLCKPISAHKLYNAIGIAIFGEDYVQAKVVQTVSTGSGGAVYL